MAFKQLVRAEIAAGLDETHRFETWAVNTPGRGYYDVHLSVIESRETCVATLRCVLSPAGKRILESGCGTGRWMAFFERLGHRAFGIDDSAGPLRVARSHDPTLRLARADVLRTPFPPRSFDVVFSSYVAEHFECGPEPLFREVHRLLKDDGLLLAIVPYNNLFRRLFTNRALQCFYLLSRLRGVPLAFTEFRYSRREMVGFLGRSGFRVEHVEPDDFHFPWAKGLSLDLGRFVLPRDAPGSWELTAAGRALSRVLNRISPWISCAGALYVARKTEQRRFEGSDPGGSQRPASSLAVAPRLCQDTQPMERLPKEFVEERTRHWLEASYLTAVATHPPAAGVYDPSGAPRRLTRYHFQEVQRKLKIFRWLDCLRFESFIDVGSGFDEYPNFVRERYGVPAYFSDFAHSMNLPYGGQEQGKLDRAVTLNIARLPFANDAFDVVLCSEVLEHLVRPVEAIAELLRVARKYLILTSLEALSANRWRRWLSHLRVDVRQPHVERNFFLLHELEAIFGADWHHENLFYDDALPASSFAPAEVQEAAYADIRDVDAFAEALCRAVAIADHRPGTMGIFVLKAKPGVELPAPPGTDIELARWLIRRTAAGHEAGARLVRQIQAGTAPFAEPDRPIAAALRSVLRCPGCRGTLDPEGAGLRCPSCGVSFAGEYGVPILYPRATETGGLDDESLRRLCSGDSRRERIVRRVMRRLRRAERPPGVLRQLFWKADRFWGSTSSQ